MAISSNATPRSLNAWEMSIHFKQRLHDRDISASEVKWAIENGTATRRSDTVTYQMERVTGETVVVKCDPQSGEICTVYLEQ